MLALRKFDYEENNLYLVPNGGASSNPAGAYLNLVEKI